MAKHARKIAEAMNRRTKTHNGFGPNQQNKHTAPNPGSQNRKRAGYGKGGVR